MLLQCVDQYGKVFLGVVRIRMVSLADGDYTSFAVAIFPAPNSKYVIGGNPDQKMAGQLETINPATVPFHQRESCSSLEEREGRLFSNLNENEVWKLLGPYFQEVTHPPAQGEGSDTSTNKHEESQDEPPKKKPRESFPLAGLQDVEPAPFKPGDVGGLELADGLDGVFEAEIIRDFLSS